MIKRQLPSVESNIRLRQLAGVLHVASLVTVIVIAGYLRFVGINWDEYQHLHPDERFLTMVETGIMPVRGGWSEYFDTDKSTLNPYNQGYSFFVYGTAPIFIVRYLAQWIGDSGFQLTDVGIQSSIILGTGYDQIHLVGRGVSAIADTLSVMLLYFVGKRLYDRKVGLLAAALLATSVSVIQQAHFFTVDSVSLLFVTLALLFAVRAQHSDSLANYVLFGLALGAAVASRINLVPLSLLIVIVAYRRSNVDGQIMPAFLRVAFAGFLSFVVFRIAQPYAFNGPAIFDIGLNQQWLNNMREIGGQMSGDVDFPPNHQWTGRTPLLFPLQNMVLWGMGPLLGITAWLGFGLAVWQLVRQRFGSWCHLLPVVWSGAYFIWQATQWVKPMRYFLPIYPTLILLAAWALCAVGELMRFKRGSRVVSVGLICIVLVATAVYAFGFTSIYERPTTRVAASRWIYDNIPGPFSLVIETSDGIVKQPVSMPNGFRYLNNEPYIEWFAARNSGVITAVQIGHLGEVSPDPGIETFRVSIQHNDIDKLPVSTGTINVDLSTNVGYTIQLERPFGVVKGQNYQLISEAVHGAPLTISGAHLVNESSWDDGLPLRMDGYDAFNGIYVGHNMELYWDDDEKKLDRMLNILLEGDYILISSNRQYASIRRLPMRYPLTISYYDALFSGELGYELVSEFESGPSLGTWRISDQDAEEPFTVYDHPKVFIFGKTSKFSIEHVREILTAVDLSSVIWMTPKNATAAPTGLMLPDVRSAEHRAGGTWSEMFDSNSLINSSQWLGILTWWGTILLLGWMLFPITFVAFRSIPDRGYAVTKLVALLLIAWLAWMLSSLRWLQFTRGTIGLVVAGLSVFGGVLAFVRAGELRSWISANRKYILRLECIWLALFLFDLFIRWQNPDLWHPAYGGEKPMDFSYFNAVLRSTSFPPFDPWLSGGYINYYYFGYVIAAVPTKLLGIVPSIAYNLLLPMLFAMTGTGVYCVVHNLTHCVSARSASRRRFDKLRFRGGLIAVAIMVLLGNLAQPDTIVKALRKSADLADRVVLPGIGATSDMATGLYSVVYDGNAIPIGTGEWYWNSTRIIPHRDGEAVPITEFPLFTFLYGDLHAHMLALPITLVALVWVLSQAMGSGTFNCRIEAMAHWFLGGLTIGALGPTNTWDLPTYMALGCMAVIWNQFQRSGRVDYHMLLASICRVVLLVLLIAILYLPYATWYGSGYMRFELWRGSTSTLGSYLKIHGLFLFIIATFLVIQTRKWLRNTRLNGPATINVSQIMVMLVILNVVFVIVMSFFSVMQVSPLLICLVSWVILLIMRPSQSTETKVTLTLILFAVLLTLVVEFVKLEGDISRMNTVFKFYFQAWTLFSVASGAVLVWLWQELPEWRPRNSLVWKAVLGMLMLTAASYSVLAISAKMRDRMAPNAPPTLDGMTFMQFAEYFDQGQSIRLKPDYDAIRWIQENVSGSPVIVEANVSEYKYGSRYTIYTGLPGVVGWSWHQRQQRSLTPPNLITDRIEAVDRFYSGSDVAQALSFIRRYKVRYVVVGGYERAYYPQSGLQKFERMAHAGLLDVAYDNAEVVIYISRLGIED